MLAAAAMALGGCKKKADDGVSGARALLDPDGGGEIVAIDVPDAGAGDSAKSPVLHALALITPVMNAPEWAPRDPSKSSDDRKGVIRLGYLRKGDTVAVKPRLVKKSSCLEGWYELLPMPGPRRGPPGGSSAARTPRSIRTTRSSRRRRTRRTWRDRCPTTTA